MKLLPLLSLLTFLAITQNKSVSADKKHNEKKKPKSGYVLTESGQLCHFPFQYGRMLHNSCIKIGKHGPRKWCSLTKNYDRDQSWSYCVEGHEVHDHCENDPCKPRGVCESTLKGYHCVCKEPYTGKHCQTDKCFDKKSLQFFNPKDEWLRYSPPVLEKCGCTEKGVVCKQTHGMACSKNLCLHGGRCIQHNKMTACGCSPGFIGTHCEIHQKETCYTGNGIGYRGTGNTTVSGAPCLHWDSDIIEHEVSMYGGHRGKVHGIDSHPYCRNPDGDTQPWCFVMKEQRLSWEHCLIPRCTQLAGTTAPPKVTKTPSPTKSSNHSASTPPPSNDTQGPVDGRIDLPVDCGRKFQKTPSIMPRIVGGLVALPASHPYIAALYIDNHFCGGSLISPCWIVTAAHCLDQRPNVTKISVVLGQSRFNTTDQHTVTLLVEKYILHEKYYGDTLQHDIALVKVKSINGLCASEFSQFVQPICLPQQFKMAESTKQCVVAGWGHQYEGAEHYAFFLQEASMPIIPYTQCQSPSVHGDRMLPGMLCAGFMEGGVDACQGDSGGPLVCEVDGRIELHGVVSWGSGCAEENKPGVYTAVISYTDWIRANIS